MLSPTSPVSILKQRPRSAPAPQITSAMCWYPNITLARARLDKSLAARTSVFGQRTFVQLNTEDAKHQKEEGAETHNNDQLGHAFRNQYHQVSQRRIFFDSAQDAQNSQGSERAEATALSSFPILWHKVKETEGNNEGVEPIRSVAKISFWAPKQAPCNNLDHKLIGEVRRKELANNVLSVAAQILREILI